jgi:hypothetical protein
MQDRFAPFDPERLVHRRIGGAPAGIRREPLEPRCSSTRRRRLKISALSIAAGAGLAVTALGALRMPIPDPVRLDMFAGAPSGHVDSLLAGRILHTD